MTRVVLLGSVLLKAGTAISLELTKSSVSQLLQFEETLTSVVVFKVVLFVSLVLLMLIVLGVDILLMKLSVLLMTATEETGGYTAVEVPSTIEETVVD